MVLAFTRQGQGKRDIILKQTRGRGKEKFVIQIRDDLEPQTLQYFEDEKNAYEVFEWLEHTLLGAGSGSGL